MVVLAYELGVGGPGSSGRRWRTHSLSSSIRSQLEVPGLDGHRRHQLLSSVALRCRQPTPPPQPGARLRCEMACDAPHWPAGTVAILATDDGAPHAIPVSAVVRGGDRRLADRPGRATRLAGAAARAPPGGGRPDRPRVAVTAEGAARVIAEPLTEGTAGSRSPSSRSSDHDRPTFAIEAGVQWRWTDDEAASRDAEVRAALARLSPPSPSDAPPSIRHRASPLGSRRSRTTAICRC